jgi:hypothetical protein
LRGIPPHRIGIVCGCAPRQSLAKLADVFALNSVPSANRRQEAFCLTELLD